MSRSISSWYDLATACAAASDRIRLALPRAGIVAALAVAEHETRCGDAWPGSRNWGACTRRPLTAAQRAAVGAAGVVPVLSPVAEREARERAATAACEAAGCPLDPDSVLHADSSPTQGVYFAPFAAFSSDVDGAAYFLDILSHTISERAALLSGDVATLARAMYSARYYTGFVSPRTHWRGEEGAWVEVDASTPGAIDGAERNILAYAGSLAALAPSIARALAEWSPGADPPAGQEAQGTDLSTLEAVQRALAQLGATLEVDGVDGPATRAAVVAFQRAHSLEVDGVAGAATEAALAAELAVRGLT